MEKAYASYSDLLLASYNLKMHDKLHDSASYLRDCLA